MRTSFLRLSLVLLASAAGVIGCQSDSASSQSAAPAGLPGGIWGTWVLETVDGVPVSEMMEPSLRSPTITILDDGTVHGFSGVNNFNSSVSPVSIQNGVFELSPTAMTMMAGPPDAMRVETRFMSDLQSATGYIVQGDTLSLTEGGMTLMTFSRGS